ncbi:chorismate synthase [Candidatus Methanoperedens nitratireducens]|uniref:Chorismate synthase n=1 Tax=Candidatus Methanoperedens nitratireducens TaxID=1392998 RepID=A0A284VTL8_9EURY|nr:chorismate synthase [Candidatus Methanoperedens nitroreducens]SNQ62538.1 chorismate synthase [Candidatus Methanoperedens nitroreducens]
MSGNTFGTLFRITTWGESHGPAVGVVIDGCPSGMQLREADIQKELNRRRPGQSDITTQRKEEDKAEILSGVFSGKTTGAPISIIVRNRDVDSSKYEELRNTPRPGHADLTYELKYGIRDWRGGGRSSARETIGRVAAGAVAKKILSSHGIEVLGHVVALGGICAKPASIEEIRENTEKNPVRCADPEAAVGMYAMIQAVRSEGDSVGGVVEIISPGVPAGVGEPVFDKLSAELARGLMSIGAVKGVEIGMGFRSAVMKGSQMNDPITIKDGKPGMLTNNAGGTLGGISNGEPIICRIAVKPTPSIGKEQCTIDMNSMDETKIKIRGRHDPSIPPRIVPVAEAMVALVLVDMMMRGGFINPVTGEK